MRAIAGRLLVAAGLWLVAAAAQAHVGSPEILYEGLAGPHRVLVRILPPDVVPGTAQVTVRALGDGVAQVAIQPVYFQTGGKGAPSPDALVKVAGDDRLWSGDLWLMEFGSSSVNLLVEGAGGSGSVVIPVPARATARRTMPLGTGIALGALGLVLYLGLIGIVRAANLDAVLPHGVDPDAPRRRRAARIAVVTGVLLAAALFAANRWWGAVDAMYLRKMYKPTELHAVAGVRDGERRLHLTLVDTSGRDEGIGDLLPDHGKLMHAFLIAEPRRDGFAHVHPIGREADTFAIVAPPLPGGSYRVIADIVHENGMAETLMSQVELPAAPAASDGRTADPDDSFHVGAPAAGDTQVFPDGTTLVWERDGAIRAGALMSMRFSLRGPDGAGLALEPYMGMVGHLAILRDDASVFVHVHPVGTVSMAAQEAFARRVGGGAGEGGMDHSLHHQAATAASFPYAFPRAGRYHVWVQVKHAGTVRTGAFAVDVTS